jgi:hypothetical protein
MGKRVWDEAADTILSPLCGASRGLIKTHSKQKVTHLVTFDRDSQNAVHPASYSVGGPCRIRTCEGVSICSLWL